MAECWKRGFASAHAARRAHRRAGFRVRVYRCEICRQFHVTNQDKRERRYRDDV